MALQQLNHDIRGQRVVVMGLGRFGGGAGVARWLVQQGATVVVTDQDSEDKLAAGIVAGHILECGGQSSGGNFMKDWKNVPDLANIGFPIAEAHPDATIYITKHDGTGGLVSIFFNSLLLSVNPSI